MVKFRALSAAFLGTVLSVTLSSGMARAQEDPAQKELEKFQGTWYSVSTESDGKRQTEEDKTDLHIITGNTCVIKLNGRIVGGSTITVEPGERNGRITFHMTAGQYTGMTWVGIYQADGDSLRWCGGWKEEIENLPSAFATKQGDHLFLRTVRRANPTPPVASTAPAGRRRCPSSLAGAASGPAPD